MKQFSIVLVLTAILFVTGCASTGDQVTLQKAKNKELAMQTQKEYDLETQKQIVLLGTIAALSMQQSPTISNEDSSTLMPSDNFTISAIDEGFQRWSSAWMIDRYVSNSARVSEKGFRNGEYILYGDFIFSRGGATHRIPYSGVFSQSEQGYRLALLCYKDKTSGMTDCIDPTPEQIAKAQSRTLLTAVLFLGGSGLLLDSLQENPGNSNEYLCDEAVQCIYDYDNSTALNMSKEETEKLCRRQC